MRTLVLDTSNPIVRFINSVRRYRDHDWKDFPSDICALTRVFIYNVIFFSVMTFLVGFVLMSAIFFWAAVPMLDVEPSVLAAVLVAVGFITNGGFLVVGILSAFEWLRGNTNVLDRIGNGLASVVVNTEDFFMERKKDSALLAMWQAFKTKTCFRVEVTPK